MSDDARKPTARERRAAEARTESSTRVTQRARPSMSAPRAGTTGTLAPRSRRPELERNIVITDRRSESSHRHHDDKRGRDDHAGASRMRSREEKEKGSAGKEDLNRSRHASTPRCDRVVTTSTIPFGTKESFGDAARAASHLSQIVFPGTEFPPPGEMSKKRSYSSMAFDCMTFLSSLNKLAIDYEATVRSLTRQLANVQKACDDHKKQKRDAEDRVATLQAAMKETEDRRRKMDGTFTESEAEKKHLKKEVADLTNRLNVGAKLQDAAVQRAVEETKREVAAMCEARIVRAREKIEAINGQLRIDIIDLAEVRSNIEFVKLLQSDKAPDLGGELVDLEKQKADLSLADEVFAKHVRELEGILTDSPVSTSDDRVKEFDADVVEEEADSDSSSSDSSSDDDLSNSAAAIPSKQAVEIVDVVEETAP